ncbi:hypothetical protein EVA_14486 [gut metagenome]|uniref:Uncharacterized protein n=1 Tax=gut metagenome TaxID=749906 RepID=J9G6I5_9ZZZZ
MMLPTLKVHEKHRLIIYTKYCPYSLPCKFPFLPCWAGLKWSFPSPK